ncbi:hypothetical protein AURDEDRAFT_164153 [Auricularia subglabra TFB-10046 SS5]|nr:hypothetical protein AURDEDRAFT_164153 [Auricularia subglabra TFB-10046 SS5]
MSKQHRRSSNAPFLPCPRTGCGYFLPPSLVDGTEEYWCYNRGHGRVAMRIDGRLEFLPEVSPSPLLRRRRRPHVSCASPGCESQRRGTCSRLLCWTHCVRLKERCGCRAHDRERAARARARARLRRTPSPSRRSPQRRASKGSPSRRRLSTSISPRRRRRDGSFARGRGSSSSPPRRGSDPSSVRRRESFSSSPRRRESDDPSPRRRELDDPSPRRRESDDAPPPRHDTPAPYDSDNESWHRPASVPLRWTISPAPRPPFKGVPGWIEISVAFEDTDLRTQLVVPRVQEEFDLQDLPGEDWDRLHLHEAKHGTVTALHKDGTWRKLEGPAPFFHDQPDDDTGYVYLRARTMGDLTVFPASYYADMACYKDVACARENFDALSRAIPAHLRESWEKLSCEPVREHGQVKSVYRADRVKLPTYQELVDALTDADATKAANMVDMTIGKIYCLTNFISAGLDLEDRQIALKAFIDGLPDELNRIQHHDLFTRRYLLREELTAYHTLQQVHMPRLGLAQTTDDFDGDDDEDFGKPEDEPLDLPSSFGNEEERARHGFVEAGRREYILRSGLASDCLARMRVAIHAYCAVLGFKNANIAGQRLGTRAESKLDSQVKEIHRWRDAYRRHHTALVTLGLTPEDALKFRPLLDDDLKNLHQHPATRAPRLGEACEPAAWFWGGDGDADDAGVTKLEALTQEELRTRWFRLRANRDRYEEEIEILHAELTRTVATFKHMQAVWNSIHTWLGRRTYALQQASIYAQRVHDAQDCAARAEELKEAAASSVKRTADRQRKQPGSWHYRWSFY